MSDEVSTLDKFLANVANTGLTVSISALSYLGGLAGTAALGLSETEAAAVLLALPLTGLGFGVVGIGLLLVSGGFIIYGTDSSRSIANDIINVEAFTSSLTQISMAPLGSILFPSDPLGAGKMAGPLVDLASGAFSLNPMIALMAFTQFMISRPDWQKDINDFEVKHLLLSLRGIKGFDDTWQVPSTNDQFSLSSGLPEFFGTSPLGPGYRDQQDPLGIFTLVSPQSEDERLQREFEDAGLRGNLGPSDGAGGRDNIIDQGQDVRDQLEFGG